MATFGEWLKQEIDRLGVSYEGFGKLLKPKRSYATISRWVSGTITPDATMIPAIARVVGVSTEEVCKRLGLIAAKVPESPRRARLRHVVDSLTDAQLEQLEQLAEIVFAQRSNE